MSATITTNPDTKAKKRLPLGNLMAFRRDPLGMLMEMARTGDDLPFINAGPLRFYLANTPEHVYEILVKQADIFYRTTIAKRILGSIGDGLLSSDGEFHKRQRRLAQPAFHYKRIESYAQVMVEHTQHLMTRWHAGQEATIDKEMMKLTLGIVAKTLFDADVSAIADSLSEPITGVLEITNDKFSAPVSMPLWVPTPRNRKQKRVNKALEAVINGFIADHRKTGADRGDLLSMLMATDDSEGKAESMSDEQLYIESLTMFLAGHETTAVALSWAWYLLSQHPKVEAKLHAELDTVLNGRLPTIQDLPQLPYTSMIVKETMRLYPPAWVVSREPQQDVTLGSHALKKGAVIFVSPYVQHRDPRYFPEPERFDPERFAEGYEKRLPRFAYYPFGGGPHICIGQSFALMEANLILATIAQRYGLQLVPGQTVELQPLVTLRPRYDLRVKVVARETVPAQA